jgi:hypothetical protein
MAMTLKRIVDTTEIPPGEIIERVRRVYDTVRREARPNGGANFSSLRPEDLERLFALYDLSFFQGEFRRALGEQPLRFRVSPRMTKAAGKTLRRRILRPAGDGPSQDDFEIAISSTLLYQTFRDVERSVTVSGIECHDRLEALQRVFEHELIHLVELALWDRSSCTAARFRSIATRFFGHTAHTHKLITPRERALRKFGIRRGDRVVFRSNGEYLEGIVNRITKRATILVEDETGPRYSDGKRYTRFYVQLSKLRMAEK